MWIEFLGFVILLIIIAIIFWIGQKRNHIKDFPPGPTSLRNDLETLLPISFSSPFTRIQKWKQLHGDIIGVKYGGVYVILLHGYKLIKEAFTDSKLNGRPVSQVHQQIFGSSRRGLTYSEGKSWSEQRKFTVKNLRDLGVGKRTLESMIHLELNELINIIKQSLSKPINLIEMLNLSVLNSLWHLIAGERFPTLNDPDIKLLLHNLTTLSNGTKPQILRYFSSPQLNWFNALITNFNGKKQIETSFEGVKSIIQAQILQHRNTFEDDNLRDFIDLYLREINDTIDKESSFYKQIGEENLIQTVVDILIGGIEPTSNILNSSLFFLSKSPGVQKKLQDEIDNIVGHFHSSGLNDRQKMPYTEAVILEILRFSPVISNSFGLPHSSIEPTKFQDFNIPKKTILLANLHDLHYDEQIWTQTNEFNPDRFLKSSKNEIDKDLQPVASFLIGKRSCPGETFAKDVIFLFLTSIFQRFHVLPTNTNSKVVKDGNFKLIDLNMNKISKFKVTFEDRLEFLDRALDLEE